MSLTAFLLTLLLPTFLGLLINRRLLNKSGLRHPAFFSLVTAPAVGFAALSLLFFWSYVVSGKYGYAITLFLTIASVCILLFLEWRSHSSTKKLLHGFGEWMDMLRISTHRLLRSKDALLWWQTLKPVICFLLFLLSLSWYVDYLIREIPMGVSGGWDARYFYNLRASFLVRAPDYWQDMFDRLIGPKDYPFLLTNIVAWGWLGAGKEVMVWPNIVGVLFFLSIVGVTFWYLTSYVSFSAACLGAGFLPLVPAYQSWSKLEYADIPLCFFITTSALLFLIALRLKEKRLFLAAGLLAGFAAWTKNEGLSFITALFIVFLPVLFGMWKRDRARRGEVLCFLKLFAWGLFPALLAIGWIKLVLGDTGGYFDPEITRLDLSLLKDPTQYKALFMAFLVFKRKSSMWYGLWLLFLAAITLKPVKWVRGYRWIIPAVILLVEASYFAGLLVTPPDVLFHPEYGFIRMALQRLFLHTGALALVFSVDVLGKNKKEG